MAAVAGVAVLVVLVRRLVAEHAARGYAKRWAARCTRIAHGGRSAVCRKTRVRWWKRSSAGVELRRERRRAWRVAGAARPVTVSVSMQGSASARYVDPDTGQVTITSVYAQ